jgi:hypothetical protein
MFFKPKHDQNKQFMDCLDRLNQRYGNNTLFYASNGIEQRWQMNQKKKNRNYTTSWQELPAVERLRNNQLAIQLSERAMSGLFNSSNLTSLKKINFRHLQALQFFRSLDKLINRNPYQAPLYVS